MPYALSFTEEFFCEGDPDAVEASDRPTSVYQAIRSLSDETWEQIARDVFGVEADRLDPLTVLDRVRETNTCSNLDSPVRVWIDEEGWYDLLIFDRGAEQG